MKVGQIVSQKEMIWRKKIWSNYTKSFKQGIKIQEIIRKEPSNGEATIRIKFFAANLNPNSLNKLTQATKSNAQKNR